MCIRDRLKIEQWIKAHQGKAGMKLPDFQRFARIMEPKVNSHDFDQQVNASLLDAKYFGIQDQGTARWPNVTLTGKNRLLLNIGTNAENALLQLHQDSIKGKVILSLELSKLGDTVMVLPVAPDAGKRSLFWTLHSPKTPKEWVRIKWAAFQEALPGKDEAGFVEVEKLYAEILTGGVESTPIMYLSLIHI